MGKDSRPTSAVEHGDIVVAAHVVSDKIKVDESLLKWDPQSKHCWIFQQRGTGTYTFYRLGPAGFPEPTAVATLNADGAIAVIPEGPWRGFVIGVSTPGTSAVIAYTAYHKHIRPVGG